MTIETVILKALETGAPAQAIMSPTPTYNESDNAHADETTSGRIGAFEMRNAANADWLTTRPRADSLVDSAGESNLVVIVDGSGMVLSKIDAPAKDDSVFPDIREGQSIQASWSEEIAAQIVRNCQQVLRSRQVRSVRVTADVPARQYEFIFIAQGREAVMFIARDITNTQKHIARLEQLAFEDPVTGLPNREWLLAELEKSLLRQNLSGGRSALVLLEIGQLDEIENISSQSHRDAVLRELAKRMRRDLRGANQSGEQDDERYSAVARVNRSLFGILLPSIETGEDAGAVAARIVKRLEAPVEVNDRSTTVRVTAGIALHPQDGTTAQELFDNAVIATNDARFSETTQQKFHSGTVRMRALERQDVEAELRGALEENEFVLSYQPVIATGSREVVAVEALLRWPKPLFGSKPIREVIAAAEYTGLILPIGEWIFRTACSQLAMWQAQGSEALQVAVNVSAQEFARADLVERTRRLIEETGIAPDRVILEITERLLFRDSVNDFAICCALKEIGVGISVDDYGTGVCSFDHLSRSPVDIVKIHPGIVARSAGGSPSRAACAAVTAMAHALEMHVVAEGVETEEQAATLAEIGCDYLQGFLFGMPVTPADIAMLCAEQARRRNAAVRP